MIGSSPQTKQDLLNELANLRDVELNFWLDIEPERFAHAVGEAWSAADTVRHLIKSTAPVTRALKLPRIFLQILFGQSRRTSISYRDLVERTALCWRAVARQVDFRLQRATCQQMLPDGRET
jgi:hypothetical protein